MAISFVKACQTFFTEPPFGRKVEISEFRALTTQDKIDLSVMLIEADRDHEPYTGEKAEN